MGKVGVGVGGEAAEPNFGQNTANKRTGRARCARVVASIAFLSRSLASSSGVQRIAYGVHAPPSVVVFSSVVSTFLGQVLSRHGGALVMVW